MNTTMHYQFMLALVLCLGPVAAGFAESAARAPDLPPVQWGEAGARECMRETARRWHNNAACPLPPESLSTHGPRVPAFPGAEGFGAYAGQTSPGDGITVTGRKFDVQTYDVIIRHIRFRRGVAEDDVDEWTTGRIDSQEEVGGLPELKTERIPDWIDTNRNGLPDWWEEARGLDASDPEIANRDSNGNGYTNLEDYLNDLEAIRTTHRKARQSP